MKVKLSIALIVVFLVIGAFVYIQTWLPKMAYIDTVKVFEAFMLKKELEVKLKKVEESRNKILDSLMTNLQVMSKNIQASKEKNNAELSRFEVYKEQYLKKKQEFEEDNQSAAKSYNDQVWQQLNQYIKDYGQKNNYKFIFGTSGNGNIMFATKSDDISEDVLKYANLRYNGAEK